MRKLTLLLLLAAAAHAQIALVAHADEEFVGPGPNTSLSNVDCTGANLVVVGTTGGDSSISITDTLGSTYLLAVSNTIGAGLAGYANLYFAKNFAGGHVGFTFTTNGATTAGIALACYSGADTISPLDTASFSATNSTVSSFAGPSLTPGVNGEAVFSLVAQGIGGFCNFPCNLVDSGFTVLDQSYGSNPHNTFSSASLIQGLAATITPTWTLENASSVTILGAAFKPSSSPPNPVTLVNHAEIVAAGPGPVSSLSMDCTGANFIVGVISGGDAYVTVNDNYSHTYLVAAAGNIGAGPAGYAKMFFAQNIVGGPTTFGIATGGSSAFSALFSCFSGLAAVPFDQAASSSTNATVSSLAAPSITTPQNGELVFTASGQSIGGACGAPCNSIDSGFSVIDQTLAASPNNVTSSAYLVQPSAGAIAPTWTFHDSSAATILSATFFAVGATPSSGAITACGTYGIGTYTFSGAVSAPANPGACITLDSTLGSITLDCQNFPLSLTNPGPYAGSGVGFLVTGTHSVSISNCSFTADTTMGNILSAPSKEVDGLNVSSFSGPSLSINNYTEFSAQAPSGTSGGTQIMDRWTSSSNISATASSFLSLRVLACDHTTLSHVTLNPNFFVLAPPPSPFNPIQSTALQFDSGHDNSASDIVANYPGGNLYYDIGISVTNETSDTISSFNVQGARYCGLEVGGVSGSTFGPGNIQMGLPASTSPPAGSQNLLQLFDPTLQTDHGVCVFGNVVNSGFGNLIVQGNGGDAFGILAASLTQFSGNTISSGTWGTTQSGNPFNLPLYAGGITVASSNQFTANTIGQNGSLQPAPNFCGALADCGTPAPAPILDGGGSLFLAPTQANFPINPSFSLPAPPAFLSFTATPSSLPAGGGTVTISWTVNTASGSVYVAPINFSCLVGSTCTGSTTASVTSKTVFTGTFRNAASIVAHFPPSTATATVLVAPPGTVLTCPGSGPLNILTGGAYTMASDLSCDIIFGNYAISLGSYVATPSILNVGFQLDCNGHSLFSVFGVMGIQGPGSSISNCQFLNPRSSAFGLFTFLCDASSNVTISGSSFGVRGDIFQILQVKNSDSISIFSNKIHGDIHEYTSNNVRISNNVVDGVNNPAQLFTSLIDMVSGTNNTIENNTIDGLIGPDNAGHQHPDDLIITHGESGDTIQNNQHVDGYEDCGIETAADGSTGIQEERNLIIQGNTVTNFDEFGVNSVCGYSLHFTNWNHVIVQNNTLYGNLSVSPTKDFHDNLIQANVIYSGLSSNVVNVYDPHTPGGVIQNNVFSGNSTLWNPAYPFLSFVSNPNYGPAFQSFSGSDYPAPPTPALITGSGNHCAIPLNELTGLPVANYPVGCIVP